MQKRIKASEKDRLAAEKLAAKNAKELADLTALHDPLKKEASNLKKQKERMEMLCRTLTQERADLKEKLRSLGALPGPDLTPGMAQEDAAPPIEAAADGAAEPNPSGGEAANDWILRMMSGTETPRSDCLAAANAIAFACAGRIGLAGSLL